jgi:hypothetical protein
MTVMAFLSACAGAIAFLTAKHFPRWLAISLCLLCVAILLTHALYLNDNLLLAQFFPTANAIVWANPQLPISAMLAGLAWPILDTPRWQRILLVTAITALAVYRAESAIIGTPPVVDQPHWNSDVCQQTTLSTCSDAAAATALRAVGIMTSEKEMAELCLTTVAGTTDLGLYRGLKIKTDSSPYRVQIFIGNVDEFLRLPPAPSIVSIRLSSHYSSGKTFIPIRPGDRHSIVLLRQLENGRIDIADPYTGRHQQYAPADLQSSWTSTALRLVPR